MRSVQSDRPQIGTLLNIAITTAAPERTSCTACRLLISGIPKYLDVRLNEAHDMIKQMGMSPWGHAIFVLSTAEKLALRETDGSQASLLGHPSHSSENHSEVYYLNSHLHKERLLLRIEKLSRKMQEVDGMMHMRAKGAPPGMYKTPGCSLVAVFIAHYSHHRNSPRASEIGTPGRFHCSIKCFWSPVKNMHRNGKSLTTHTNMW